MPEKMTDYHKCHCAMNHCPCNRRFKEFEKEVRAGIKYVRGYEEMKRLLEKQIKQLEAENAKLREQG